MKLWSTIHKCYVETIGIISGNTILCMTEDGKWVHGHPDNLVKDRPKEDVAEKMTITVGHVIDNPTFDCHAECEITQTYDDGYVEVLWDTRKDGNKIPVDILVQKITYMIVNTNTGVLRLEVG